jgi:hypothetical protein
VHVPSNYTNVPTPVLMLYHGYTNTAVGFNRTSGASIVRGHAHTPLSTQTEIDTDTCTFSLCRGAHP